MRKAVTDIEIVYEQVEIPPEESQQRLNDMFDVLFDETFKYLKEKKEAEKLKLKDKEKTTMKGGETEQLWITQTHN